MLTSFFEIFSVLPTSLLESPTQTDPNVLKSTLIIVHQWYLDVSRQTASEKENGDEINTAVGKL